RAFPFRPPWRGKNRSAASPSWRALRSPLGPPSRNRPSRPPPRSRSPSARPRARRPCESSFLLFLPFFPGPDLFPRLFRQGLGFRAFSAEGPQRQIAREFRTGQSDQRRVGRHDDPSLLQPVMQGLAAKTAVVERRENCVQISGPLSLQLREELVDGRGPDRKREESL